MPVIFGGVPVLFVNIGMIRLILLSSLCQGIGGNMTEIWKLAV